MTVSAQKLMEVCERTWPAARMWNQDGWDLRDGMGGGKRVSAATCAVPGVLGDIDAAADAMRGMSQYPLFMVRGNDGPLDDDLALRGYKLRDPVTLYSAPIERLLDLPIPKVTAFCIWEPLAIMTEIWAKGGIGPARIAVMERAKIKTGILARWNEQPAGTAFAAVHDGVAMVHAVEVLEHQRKQGVAGWLMRASAKWAAEHGAHTISVLCTDANMGANALYSGLGFERVGHYHYRELNTKKDI